MAYFCLHETDDELLYNIFKLFDVDGDDEVSKTEFYTILHTFPKITFNLNRDFYTDLKEDGNHSLKEIMFVENLSQKHNTTLNFHEELE